MNACIKTQTNLVYLVFIILYNGGGINRSYLKPLNASRLLLITSSQQIMMLTNLITVYDFFVYK